MIEIVQYDARWPEEFRVIAAPIRAALGDLAVRVDHIGSTSVPGLAAKDIIDVQVSAVSLDAIPIEGVLAQLGYTMRTNITRDHIPPGWEGPAAQWQKLFFGAPHAQRPTNLHIRRAGRANQRYALLFRDYLRADPRTAKAYQQVKEALARQHPDDIEAYLGVKDPVCDIVMRAAELWAAETGYAPGPSDI